MAAVFFCIPMVICAFITKYFMLDLEALKTYSSPFVSTFSLSCSYAQLVFVALYLLVILGIRNRYKKVNHIFEMEIFTKNFQFENDETSKNKIYPITASSTYDQHMTALEVTRTLKNLSKLHLRVHNMIYLTNHIFVTPFMISFGFYISAGVFSLYELFSIFSVKNVTLQQIGFCFVVSSWWPNSVFIMILQIACCMTTVSEGNRTSKILRNILCKEKNEKIRKQLQIFLQQVSHSKPVFSCGLFEFNWETLGIVRKNIISII